MRMSEFVAAVSSDFKKIVLIKKPTDIWVEIENEFALVDLYNLLISSADDARKVSFQTLKSSCDALSQRWLEIKFTDSIYLHHPYTLANQCYLILERHLAAILNEKIYTFLMPPVIAAMPYTSRGDLSLYRLHEFVLGDDSKPIEIASCLTVAAQKRIKTLYHTADPHKPLTYAEWDRVVHHSYETEAFYNALEVFLDTGDKKPLLLAQQALDHALHTEDYNVQASYGLLGRRRLANVVTKRLCEQKELINIMNKRLEPKAWKDFLSVIDTQELRRILLQGDSWTNTVQKQSSYCCDQNYNAAILFCLLEFYLRTGLANDHFKDQRSWLTQHTKKYFNTSFFIGGFSKKEKEDAALALQNFLLTGLPFYLLEDYFKTSMQTVHQGPLFQYRSYLASITKQINTLANPDAKKEPTILKKVI